MTNTFIIGRKAKTNKITIFLSLFLMVFCFNAKLFSQSNMGFENRLTGWDISGDPTAVSIDSVQVKTGIYALKIGNASAGILQKTAVIPLSLLELSAFINCSDSTISGNIFLRFYNADSKLIVEYSSKSKPKTGYQYSRYYTEAPPESKYLAFGIDRDQSGKGFILADDVTLSLNATDPVSKHEPQCNLEQYMRPFWKSDTVFNETVLLYSENGGLAKGKLLFNPKDIISIQRFDLEKTFSKGTDYTVNGREITRTENSEMPFRADTSFSKADLAWYNIQSQWVVVTYTHDDRWDGAVQKYRGKEIPKTMEKLINKSPLRIVTHGMSITRGMNMSSYDNVPPYMPTYVDLFANQLKKMFGYDDITLINAGLPGATAQWGAQYAEKYVNPLKPDLVILDFGMNDFWSCSPSTFESYMKTMIFKIRAEYPNAEFLLLSNMSFDPDYVLDSDTNKSWYVSNMAGYPPILKSLEANGIINLNMAEISDTLYKCKKAKDCITNPLHPNDYLARWYAQCMAALFDNH
jgi:lysophospholipase L1-like esterase